VRLGDGARAACRPLGHDAVRLKPESWLGAWQAVNRAATIPHCIRQLAETGTLDNLRRKAGEFAGPRRGMRFSDSDVYKTLEAIGWEHDPAAELLSASSAMTDTIVRAQDDDGYVHSWYGLDGHDPWSDLTNGHEMYCAGHLIQAGVAMARAGDGTVTLAGLGRSGAARDWAGGLYRPATGPGGPGVPVRWVAVPYYRWANRGESPMRVWLPASAEGG